MRTSKPVSTISYNTPAFLRDTLARMMDNREIAFWCFVPHKGEGGDKDHVHLYVEPSRLRTQDEWKHEYFAEFDPSNPTRPLSVTTWRHSNWVDWYKYGLHDALYLALKGETKQFEYTPADMVFSDADAFAERVAEADTPIGDKTFRAVKHCVDVGMTWSQMLASGIVPTRNIGNAKEIYNALKTEKAKEARATLDEQFPIVTDERENAFVDGLFG